MTTRAMGLAAALLSQGGAQAWPVAPPGPAQLHLPPAPPPHFLPPPPRTSYPSRHYLTVPGSQPGAPARTLTCTRYVWGAVDCW